MNYEAFYADLFRPIESEFGPFDAAGIFHIIGFDFGGPVNCSTIGYERKSDFVTYVTCELCVREEQKPSSQGRFELMCHSNDEKWVSDVLTSIARTSLETELDHLHTFDVSQIVDPRSSMKGVVLERFAASIVEGQEYSIMRVHGVTPHELECAIEGGGEELIDRLKDRGVYPRTDAKRESII